MLLLVLVLYVAASLLPCCRARLTTTVVQRAVFRLREQVEAKLTRLPLSYFDRQPRGELLSRVTNDIDNIAQTLQQTLSQMVTSLLTIVGVLGMMFWISPLLAVDRPGHRAGVRCGRRCRSGKRAQPQFIDQWAHHRSAERSYRGDVHRTLAGQGVRPPAGGGGVFREHNEQLYSCELRAQFVSGIIQPAMMFIGNINYVLVAVVGGLRVASGAISLGDVQAFIQYSRQFSQPLTQVASMANLLQSGIASAERVFALLDEAEQSADPVAGHASVRPCAERVAFENVSFRYDPEQSADRGPVTDRRAPVTPWPSSGRPVPARPRWSTCSCASTRWTPDGSPWTVSTSPPCRRDELRENIGMVLQDTWLFGGTIAREHRLWRRTIRPTRRSWRRPRPRTWTASCGPCPDGYDTVIDEEGANVSAGEKQLITIARAFLAEPVILILDEATSSVDTRTEVLVQRAMTNLRTAGPAS